MAPRLFISLQGMLSTGDLALSPKLGVKAAIGFSTLSWLTPGASYSITSIPLEYDNISGVSATDLTISSYRAHLGVPLVSGNTSLLADAGLGLSTVSIHPITISLGALGNRILPAQREQFFTYSFGIVFRQKISGNVAIEIQPEAIFLPSSASVGNLYSIGGGLNIGIL